MNRAAAMDLETGLVLVIERDMNLAADLEMEAYLKKVLKVEKAMALMMRWRCNRFW